MLSVGSRQACGSGLAAALGAGLLALAAAGPASAGDGSVFPNYTFPNGDRGFMLVGRGGLIEPCVLVGFGPLSNLHDLPPTTLGLTEPPEPDFTNPFEGQDFFLRFVIMDLGDGVIALPDAPNSDGNTGFTERLGGHTFDITFAFGPGVVDRSSWVGFNPQPDPPGDVLNVAFSFQAASDPFFSFTMKEDGQPLSFALQSVPEPAAWSLLIAGFALAGGRLRRRARAPLPA